MELLFKDEYFQMTLSGEKFTTIRKGVRIPESRDLVLKALRDSNDNFEEDIAYATLDRLEFKTLFSLTNQDAENDGFQDKRELEEVLTEIYSDIGDETMFTIFEFTVKD